MAFKFPFTNYHELNLTWVLEQLKKLFEDSEENVETIESYENRLSAVETELPTVEATANQAEIVANAAASLAQTAKNTADTANENALAASAQAGLARQEAAAAEAEAQAATQAAQQAQATAQNFNGRITQAEDDASEALQEAQSFENRVNAAINTANNAANTATIAQGIAVNANQNAATALDTAQTADGKAEAAQDAADIADGKAEAAQDAADLADEKADTNAANIGNLANLTTTAKNNLVAAINEAAQSGGSGDNTNCAPLIINTVSGAVATFTDGADNRKIHKVIGTIVPIQSGTGTPAPDNVRPISGYIGANIIKAKNNLLSNKFYRGFSYNSPIGTTFTPVEDSNVIQTDNGFEKVVSAWGNTCVLSYPLTAGPYKVNIALNAPSARSTLYVLDKNYKTTRNPLSISGDYIWTSTFTLTTEEKYIACFLASSTAGTITYTEPRINSGAVDKPYNVPVAVSLPINWENEAGVIYGGMVTLNEDGSADVVSTHNLRTITHETAITSTKINGNQIFSVLYGTTAETAGARHLTANMEKSNQLEIAPASNIYNYGAAQSIGVTDDGWGIRVQAPANISDVTGYKTWLESIGELQLWYPRSSSKSYHFDNIGQLFTYLGDNNVWIDTGAITECTYPADTKLYIDGKVAELQALILEN